MSHLKILVVDDDPVTLKLLNKRLSKEEYVIETADNGADAVRKIFNESFDAVLTDLMMPGDIDGIGVLEAAKEANIKTEVILITAFASLDNAIEAMKKGAADYLQKPINFDELILRLEKIKNVKMLIKNASDLREAMDVTEQTSAQTIQELELMVGKLQQRIDQVKSILSEPAVEADIRIQKALEQINSA